MGCWLSLAGFTPASVVSWLAQWNLVSLEQLCLGHLALPHLVSQTPNRVDQACSAGVSEIQEQVHCLGLCCIASTTVCWSR